MRSDEDHAALLRRGCPAAAEFTPAAFPPCDDPDGQQKVSFLPSLTTVKSQTHVLHALRTELGALASIGPGKLT